MKKLTTKLVLLGLLILVFGIGGRLMSSQLGMSTIDNQLAKSIKKEELEWKKYDNKDYNFELNYPADWTMGEVKNKAEGQLPEAYIYFRPESLKTENPSYGLIQLSVYKLNLELDKFIESYICLTPGNCALAKDAKDIEVAGVKAKRIEDPPSPVKAKAVSFKKGERLFNVAVVLDKVSDEKYTAAEKEAIYQRVLDSFHFKDSQALVKYF